MDKFDFSGWATRANLKCSDGRTIMKNAFADNDGQTVPLVWNHQHNDPNEVLGHALLKNLEDGVYAYCKFNDTESGKTAKLLVKHGDVNALSIYANQLKEQMSNVIHGNIREVSLVLAGANPGACIENVSFAHGEECDDEAVIYSGELLEICHSDKGKSEEKHEVKSDEISHADKENDESKKEKDTMAEKNNKTVQDVLDTLNEEQQNVVYGLIGKILEDYGIVDADDEEGEEEMKHNVFYNEDCEDNNVLSHAALETIIADGKKFGSLKESFLAHSEEYGIEHIDYLFPEAQNLNNPPDFIKREMGWVQTVMGGVHHSPFSRIKSTFADITEDDARARGYIKGKLKKEEVFTLLKRTTTPTTVYKKQKLDRDDIVDITDFDVIAWIKSEMRMMLDEELARAILVGDGRLASSDDKINPTNIRPIFSDEALYTIQKKVNVAVNADEDDIAKATIKAAVKARKDYKGSGEPTLFTTEDMLTDCLLLEDTQGHRLYKTESELASAMRVKNIVTVPVMENQAGVDGGDLLGIIVNLADYNVGADKGGEVNMFDDFDIDYNQQKYLIETRCSGALTKPYSAIALELNKATA